MKKILLFIVLLVVLFISSIGSARQSSNEALQDIEDLFVSNRISKEEYLKMKQNVMKLEQQDSAKVQVLSYSEYEAIFGRYADICNTQGATAGKEYIDSLRLTPKQREGFSKVLEGELARRKARQSQSVASGLGRGLAAAANAFNQNAQQAQQRADEQARQTQQNRPKTTTGSIRPDYSGGYVYRETTQ